MLLKEGRKTENIVYKDVLLRPRLDVMYINMNFCYTLEFFSRVSKFSSPAEGRFSLLVYLEASFIRYDMPHCSRLLKCSR